MKPRLYRVASKSTEQAAVTRLRDTFGLEADPAASLAGIYLDTFDGRLLKAGISVVESFDSGDGRFWFVRSSSRTEQIRFETGQGPRRRRELAGAGPLCAEVAAAIGIRALLPQVAVKIQLRPMRAIDRRHKTVARLRLESGVAWDPRERDPKRRRLTTVLVLTELKGYAKQAARLAAILEAQDGIEVEPDTLAERAMERCGIERPQSKRPVALLPEMTARQATVAILRHELDRIERNEPGTRADLDSEFLHDFRVAVRRTRSAISQTPGVLDPRKLQRFKQEFRWLGQRTGPTRDLDVYLLKMPNYRKELPKACRADLAPLGEFLVERQRAEQSSLAADLGSARHRRLVRDWRKFLAAASTGSPKRKAPNAERLASEFAAERIRKRFRRVLRDGNAIEASSPNEALHRLRIDCKKLRYMLEFFSTLFEPRQVRGFVGSLKSLQDTLGDFQDLEVQQQALEQFGGELSRRNPETDSTLLAMGRLIERLRKAQHRERLEFHRRFERFASRENRRRFLKLFPKPARPQDEEPVS